MPIKRSFRDTVIARAKRDKEFRQGMLLDGFANLMFGNNDEDVFVGRSAIRDYINATIGFEKLAAKTGINIKSLMRMFGPKGNPREDNLRVVLRTLFKHEHLKVGYQSAEKALVAA